MTLYLLDTCTISDFFKDVGKTQQRLRAKSPSEIALSAVSTMEVLYGLQINVAARRKFSTAFASLCAVTTILPFDLAAAEVAAAMRAQLKIVGRPIGSFDLLIGATAVAHGCVLVTSNVVEFAQVKGLPIENWR